MRSVRERRIKFLIFITTIMYHSFISQIELQHPNTGTALKSLSLKAQELAVGQAKYSRELQREHEVQTRQLRLDLADARRALSDIRISSMRASDTKRTCNEEDIIKNTEETMAIEELDHSTDAVVEELPILPSGQDLLSSSRRRRPRSSSSSSNSSSDSKKQSISSSKNNQGELQLMNNLMTKIENEEKYLKRTTEEIDQLIERVKLDTSVIYDESEEKLSMDMLNPSDSSPSSVSPTHDSKISSFSTNRRRRHRRRDTKEFREKMHALRYKLRAHGYVRQCLQSITTHATKTFNSNTAWSGRYESEA